MIYTFNDETISFDIKYKKRKTIAISINPYGKIELEVPRETTQEVITKAVEQKWDWIMKRTKEMKERLEGPQTKAYDMGEVFLYLGKSYPILIFEDSEIGKDYVELTEDQLHIYVKSKEEERIKQALKRFYYQKCKTLVNQCIKLHQSKFKTKPRSVSISESQSTWGTCDSKYQMTFNWKLAMAPLEVIDYVVVHEMCHMVHLNHDRSFWRLVGSFLPDYEHKQNWLALSSWKMVV
ncbi:MAG: SprT family zinc-dependent metalloprotease [Mobilitalea sp.]